MFEAVIAGTPPSCVIAPYANALSFNATTSGGKAIMVWALAAKASGSNVTAYGTGACGIYGSYVEDLSYGVLQ